MKNLNLLCTKLCKYFNFTSRSSNENNSSQKESFIEKISTPIHEVSQIEMEHLSHPTIKDFTIIKTLGKGTFGKVLLVYNKTLDQYYAMKVLKKHNIKKNHQLSNTRTEREILEKITHPFVVKLAFAFQNENNLYMLTEFMQGGELFYHLHKENFFSESRTRFYICELVLALQHLHKHNIIYRDLKPENVLLDLHGHIKLIDFGLSKILRDNRCASLAQCNIKDVCTQTKTFTVCGTLEYLAPEVLLGKGYDKAVDWWSLGILMYEMLVGFTPFKDTKRKPEIKVYQRKVFKHKNISDVAYDLITKLLEFNPAKRIGSSIEDAEEIKRHRFFRGIKWEDVVLKKVKPLFKPNANGKKDVRNFDKMFTDEDPNEKISNIKDKRKNNKLTETTCDEFNVFEDFTYLNKNNILVKA